MRGGSVCLCRNTAWRAEYDSAFLTMFNVASTVFGTITMRWAGMIAANAVIILVSIITIKIFDKILKEKFYINLFLAYIF